MAHDDDAPIEIDILRAVADTPKPEAGAVSNDAINYRVSVDSEVVDLVPGEHDGSRPALRRRW